MFVSHVSGLFLKLIYQGAGTVVQLVLLKFSMVRPYFFLKNIIKVVDNVDALTVVVPT